MAEVIEQSDELAALWEWFAGTLVPDYSPLYTRIAGSVAQDRALLDLVREAPPEAHMPLVLLAAVHYLVLDGVDHPLAAVYAGRSRQDPAPLFHDLCMRHRREILEVMSQRRVQTNEVGRSALLGPALTQLGGVYGLPLHLVDVGASAGLNLCCDRYLLDYGEWGRTGRSDAEVHISCEVRGGNPPIASRLGPISRRVGIDLDPVDLDDPQDVQWLLACVWPDTGRLERTRRAIEAVRRQRPRVVGGDAVDVLPAVLGDLPPDGVACVVTTWVMAYLSPDKRARFVELLAEWGERRPVVWVCGESVGVVEPLRGVESGEPGDPATGEVLTAVSFVAGSLQPKLLARVHPHGRWLDWQT